MEIESDADPEIVERTAHQFRVGSVAGISSERAGKSFPPDEYLWRNSSPELKYKTFIPRELRLTGKSQDLFEELRRHDVLLHHPFDSYESVVSFIESAAEDDRVLTIKQTLYRTNEHSLIVPALIAAADKKEVTAVVELKARFDEDHNIRWSRDLEDAGVQVFHGLVGLKTHCKLSLLVRRDPDGVIRRYAHLGTGNYNVSTAKTYTDLSLLTADPAITEAVHDVF
jgi:polyphosphate kinase